MKISDSYRPQSRDTHPKFDKFLMQSFRKMASYKKANLVNEANKGIWQCSLIVIRNQYPNIPIEQIPFQIAIRWLGKELSEKILTHNRGQLVETNTTKLALKIVDIFDSLKISYLIGGSVASSILSEPRATLDIDMVADLQLSQVQPLFVLSDRPLAQVEMQRRQQLLITKNPEKFAWLPSSEDMVLQKLTYCLGNEISDRQWRDVLGVLKVQADKLDLDYLSQWAETLNLTELITKALQHAGIN